jgi:glycosyltransferase involved in cell wall biosynthesis
MNVAVDTNCIVSGKVGGIENYTVALVEALVGPASCANRVVLLTRPENHATFERFAGDGARVELVDRPIGGWASAPEAARLAFQAAKTAILRQLDVDVVHFPGNTINPVDIDFPSVLNLHDLQHRHFPEYFSAGELENRERWWTASAHRADAMIAASGWTRDDLVTHLGVDAGKIFVTPDPVESAFARCGRPKSATDGAPTCTDQKTEIPAGSSSVRIGAPSLANSSGSSAARGSVDVRRKFDLPTTTFLYPAAFWPHKNHKRLIDAFAAADLPDAQLLLTGGGQDDGRLAALVTNAGMAGRVRLLGRVSTDDLIGLYRTVTATIVPSLHESWSIPVAEAMACRCPVACSTITSLPEQVGDAGVLFDPTDVPAIRGVIRRLARDEELRETLVDRGRRRTAAATGRHFIDTVERAYRHAIAGRSRPRRAA